jgi:hypothetical protein
MVLKISFFFTSVADPDDFFFTGSGFRKRPGPDLDPVLEPDPVPVSDKVKNRPYPQHANVRKRLRAMPHCGESTPRCAA